MLRVLVLLLLAANALFFAWTQGWLDSVVGPARPEREPQRLAAQVRPELVQILPPVGASAASDTASNAAPEPLASASGVAPGSAASAGVSAGASAAAAPLPAVPVVPKPSAPAASAAPSAVPPASPTSSAPPSAAVVSTAAAPTATTRATAASTASAPSPGPVLNTTASAPGTTTTIAAAASASNVCLEAGPYTPAEVNAAEAALKPLLASGGWVQRKASSGGEWMIYMGPYPDRESMDRKKAELARIRGGVPQEELSAPPELARGLSLGRFPSPTAANATLAQYRLRGIRTARVVQSSSGAAVVYLRVAQADPAIAARLTGLKPPPAGRAFSACPR